tara:strand:+ start:39 stop:182 length:144 start_codon:yes stop_codon:yes gene_type:complete
MKKDLIKWLYVDIREGVSSSYFTSLFTFSSAHALKFIKTNIKKVGKK